MNKEDMLMSDRQGYSSLLEYLKRKSGGLCLKLSTVAGLTSNADSVHSPFTVIGESAPFSRILAAEICSDSGSCIRKVNLLLSKDAYMSIDDMPVLTNVDLDNAWQRVFEQGSRLDSVIRLAGQVSDDQKFMPFEGMLYCKEKGVFFHLPCPNCGNSLELCRDDDILKDLGLPLYSASLMRYLHCPSCRDSNGETAVYAYKKHNYDPAFVRDAGLLIDDLMDNMPGTLPCSGCVNKDECCGNRALAHERIITFSFYPFYMIIKDAPTINACDFLGLISGASFDDMAQRLYDNRLLGRLMCLEQVRENAQACTPVFFQGDPRYFLELLYLKLTFLSQLCTMILSGIDDYRYPDLGSALERIWVKLENMDSGLPFFWNFRLVILESGEIPLSASDIPVPPPAYGAYYLGHLWFDVLTANHGNTGSVTDNKIRNTIREYIADINDQDRDSAVEGQGQTIDPAEIFLDQDVYPIHQRWVDLWNRSLEPGWFLLKCAKRQLPDEPIDTIYARIDEIISEIKAELMGYTPVVIPDNDEAIGNIIERIASSWPSLPVEAISDEDADKTIIQAPAVPSQDQAVEEEDLEDFQETVILSSADINSMSPEQGCSDTDEQTLVPGKTPGLEGEYIPETVIMKPQLLDDKEDIPETIILKPQNQQVHEEIDETVIMSAQPKNQVDDIPETVIIRKTGETGAAEQKKEGVDVHDDEEDFLEETVILTPKKDK